MKKKKSVTSEHRIPDYLKADKRIHPIDTHNLDGCMGKTARQLDWPETFSERARWSLYCMNGFIALFFYCGKYVIATRTGHLTRCGKGTMDDPVKAPFEVCSSLEEVEELLEEIPEDYLYYWKEGESMY